MIYFVLNAEPNNFGGGFIAIQDQVKMEPRDQQGSPLYGIYQGNYRIPQTTPSPTPSIPTAVSPSPMYMAQATSPSPYHPNNLTVNGTANQIDSILQNHLQAPRSNMNAFQPQATQQSHYTPNIPPVTSYSVASTIWTPNNLSVNGTCVPSTSRVYTNNMSTIFTQQPLNPVQNFNVPTINCEPNKSNFSSLLDLDSQQLLSEQVLNLSGEMQNLSFGDCVMESFSKHDK